MTRSRVPARDGRSGDNIPERPMEHGASRLIPSDNKAVNESSHQSDIDRIRREIAALAEQAARAAESEARHRDHASRQLAQITARTSLSTADSYRRSAASSSRQADQQRDIAVRS